LPQRSVLIVDESDESREVLRTALTRLGTRIYEASQAAEGLELARTCRPDLIVLDLELHDGDSDWGEFEAAARQHRTPLVIIGSARRDGARVPGGQFIEKPYHYAPLVRRIEDLLGDPL
jgi:DNA-binding response OmpR family regulator